MPFIVGCSKGKHKDYQVWGSESNCMKKKMKKNSSFKEWFVEEEDVLLEGLFDHLERELDSIEYFKDQPNLLKDLKEIVRLYLKKFTIMPTLSGSISQKSTSIPEKDNERLNFLLSRVPWDVKHPFDKLLRTGDVNQFQKDLENRPLGAN